MSTASIDFCLAISGAHAALTLKLDDELGTHHGLGLQDFILLHRVAGAPDGRVALTDLVRPMGVPASMLMRQLIALEKTGHLERETAARGVRTIAIRPSGRRILNEAMRTADEVCAELLRELPAESLPLVAATLSRLADADALTV
jgi:DNA-binding MarR family transcriptional regulator